MLLLDVFTPVFTPVFISLPHSYHCTLQFDQTYDAIVALSDMTPLSRTLSSESSTISERIQRTTAFAAPPVPPPRPPSPPTRPSIALSEASAGAARARAQEQQPQSQSQSQPQPLQQNRRRLLFGWPRRATAASNEIKADAAKAAGARVLAAEQRSAAETPREDASQSHGQDVTLHRSPPRPAVLPNEFPSRGPNGEALAVLSARQYLAVVTSEGKVRLMRTVFGPPLTTQIVCAPSSPK